MRRWRQPRRATRKKKTFRIYQQGLWDGTRHPCEHFSNYDDSNVDGGHHHHHLRRPSIVSVPYTRKIRPMSMTSLVPLISCRMVSIRVSFKFILADMVTAGLTMEVPTNKHRASSCKSSWIMPLYYSPWGSYICVCLRIGSVLLLPLRWRKRMLMVHFPQVLYWIPRPLHHFSVTKHQRRWGGFKGQQTNPSQRRPQSESISPPINLGLARQWGK